MNPVFSTARGSHHAFRQSKKWEKGTSSWKEEREKRGDFLKAEGGKGETGWGDTGKRKRKSQRDSTFSGKRAWGPKNKKGWEGRQ